MSLSFPVSPSTGQGYQGWTWDGSKWTTAPSGTAAHGTRVLLSNTVVASAVASVDLFTGFDGTYDEIEVVFFDVQPSATGDQIMWMRCSADGSTFDATGPYWYVFNGTLGTPSASNAPGGSLTATLGIPAIYAQNNSNAGWGCYSKMSWRLITTPQSSCIMQGQNLNGTTIVSFTGAGAYKINTMVKGLRFYMASGNISRGTFKLYGIVK